MCGVLRDIHKVGKKYRRELRTSLIRCPFTCGKIIILQGVFMGDATTYLSFIATLFGVIGSMTAAISWISKKNEERMGRAIKDALSPLTHQMETLNNNLCESKEDRRKIHEELEEHEDKLFDHDKRISLLEKP